MDLKNFLDQKVEEYNQPSFITDDPISIPRAFSKKEDIEIAGLFAALLAWGQRKTIITKCLLLLELMDNDPHSFIVGHQEDDLKRFLNFKHRTFNEVDTLYFIAFLRYHYQSHDSLEDAFLLDMPGRVDTIEQALINFHDYFFSLDIAPHRTRKHIATPIRKSACKRLNMYLRWMVRRDENGVDFGLWNRIRMSDLVCPCDLHVDRIARRLGLITRSKTDWATALELTANLKKLDSQDPVKYDFALFGLGVEERYRKRFSS